MRPFSRNTNVLISKWYPYVYVMVKVRNRMNVDNRWCTSAFTNRICEPRKKLIEETTSVYPVKIYTDY